MHLQQETIQGFVGFFFLLALTFCFSTNKRAIDWKLILSAFILQNLLFLLIHYVPVVSNGLGAVAAGLVNLLAYAESGAKFIFGNLVDNDKLGFIFLLVVVPALVFFGAFIGVLYFFGIIQRAVYLLSHILRKCVKLSGAESFVVVADIFLGQSEGPMVIGPYVKSMTKSELACAFTAGLANISGSTMGIYLDFLGHGDKTQMMMFASYLLTASVMNAISAIVFAKILFPETDFENVSSEKVTISVHTGTDFLDSVFKGAMNGMKIGVSMTAALIAIIALVNMCDGILHLFGNLLHINDYIVTSTNGVFAKGLSIEYILGQLFRVFAFFMGIAWHDTLLVGSLLGQKVAVNEFVAYIGLGHMKDLHQLSGNSIFISTFALCSFSNFSSIGISLGAFSVLAPSRQHDLTQIAWKALFGAVMAGFMTATIAGFWHNLLG